MDCSIIKLIVIGLFNCKYISKIIIITSHSNPLGQKEEKLCHDLDHFHCGFGGCHGRLNVSVSEVGLWGCGVG